MRHPNDPTRTVFVPLLFAYTPAAYSDCTQLGLLVLRSSAVPEKIYHPFTDADCARESKIIFGNIDYNPLTANQPRDLEYLKPIVLELAAKAPQGVVILAYSETGKFAAKLASMFPHVKALFLMDPVDGTPPFSSPQKFPIFLNEDFPILRIPVTVLESEYGPKFKRLGHSCVPENMGPSRFYRFIETQALTRVFMDGLDMRIFFAARNPTSSNSCVDRGPAPRMKPSPEFLSNGIGFSNKSKIRCEFRIHS